MGDFCDPFSPVYDPVICGGANPFPPLGPGGFTSQGGGGTTKVDITVLPAPVPVTVSIPTSLGTTIATALGGIIKQALGDQVASIGTILTTITNTILIALSAQVQDLSAFVKNAFSELANTIGKILGGIVTGIGNAITTIFGGIVDVLKGIRDALKLIAAPIVDKIQTLVDAVKAGNLSAVIPIIQAVATEAYNIRNIIAAIQTDIHGGLKGIIAGVGQITDSIASLDATLARALQQIGFTKDAHVGTDVVFDDVGLPRQWMNQFADTFGIAGDQPDIGSAIGRWQQLINSCVNQEAITDVQDVVNRFNNAPFLIKWFFTALTEVVFASSTFGAILKKQFELGVEQANKQCPINKLPPSTAIEAAIRGFMTSSELREELIVQGWNDKRIHLMSEVANAKIDGTLLIDAWYQRIISDTDLSSGLHAFAYSDTQIEVLKKQASHLPQADELFRWFNFTQIDETQLRDGLAKLRFSQDQVKHAIEVDATQETVQQQVLLHGRLEASGKGYASQSLSIPDPQEVIAAAKRDKLSPGNAHLQWIAHWQFPSYQSILQSYFRGLRTLNDVHLSMEAENIPSEFWDELEKLARPLLPFRSVPAYLVSGTISEGDAILELSAHGFDPVHIRWIIEQAKKSKGKGTGTTVATIGNLSIATARTLFDDGAISSDQYISVLEAHKYPHDVAVLQAQADETSFHVKQRRQQITDLVNEVDAGMVTIDDALQSLHQGGFTMAEIARFQKEVRKARVSNTKRPSIGEMKTFLKAQLITLEQFKNELAAQGWNDPWLSAFVALETP